MIKTPLSTVIGGAFWTPGATMIGGTKLSFETVMKKLFANGEQGFWYDPNDLSTMFQDAAGTIPVTAAEQPVGLMKDKSGRNNHASQTVSASRPILQQTPILAANLLPTYDFRTWGVTGTPNPLTANSFTTATSGGVQAAILKPNTKYMLEIDIENTSNVNIYHGASTNTVVASGTRRKVLVQVTTDTGIAFYLRNSSAGTTTVYSIKVQEIIGYRTDQKYLKFDGVDDRITTTLPTQLTGCTVIRSVPNVGTQILTNQTIPTIYNDNIDNCGLIVINRALTASETSQITKLFNKAAGV